MASTFQLFLLLCTLLLLFTTVSPAQTSSRPRALLIPVYKDTSSLQYYTHINQRTPLTVVKLTVDLGGRFLWVDCETSYNSSTYRPAHCGSTQCNLAKSVSCGDSCFIPPNCPKTCGLSPYNSITGFTTGGDLTMDVITIPSTDGTILRRSASIPNFLFTCTRTFFLEGLAKGVTGMVGLGRHTISLPSQFSAAFSIPRKFAICLGSNSGFPGVIFFGNGPYNLLPDIDASESLLYTPLLINPVVGSPIYSPGFPSAEYFIGVKSINISGKAVLLNTTLLSINNKGVGGTSLSTVVPYTVMETSIYKAITRAFVNAISSVPRVASVHPFEYCFNSKNLGVTRVGYAVPQIDLVLQSSSVYWAIFGANSMVQVSDDAACLGFVDGGLNPRTSIVIGGYQLEDNLLQFDVATSRLGFSSSLLFRRTTCSNFNFTSIP